MQTTVLLGAEQVATAATQMIRAARRCSVAVTNAVIAAIATLLLSGCAYWHVDLAPYTRADGATVQGRVWHGAHLLWGNDWQYGYIEVAKDGKALKDDSFSGSGGTLGKSAAQGALAGYFRARADRKSNSGSSITVQGSQATATGGVATGGTAYVTSEGGSATSFSYSESSQSQYQDQYQQQDQYQE